MNMTRKRINLQICSEFLGCLLLFFFFSFAVRLFSSRLGDDHLDAKALIFHFFFFLHPVMSTMTHTYYNLCKTHNLLKRNFYYFKSFLNWNITSL